MKTKQTLYSASQASRISMSASCQNTVDQSLVVSAKTLSSSTPSFPLLPGETILPKAPAVVLDDGTNCIPQHFLSYQHSKQSVSEIIAEIDFDPRFVLFVDEDKASVFIQVGIIGKDNYVKHDDQNAEKIVYGRRWRVEPQLPSSEIIQTAFLALLKAREHEIRELFKHLSANPSAVQKSTITTPFSCHHDLPLMAMSRTTDLAETKLPLDEAHIKDTLASIRYDHASIDLVGIQILKQQQLLLEIQIIPSKLTTLPELNQQTSGYIVVEDSSEDGILNSIMDYVLQLSHRYTEEHFRFKGFARFSRNNNVSKISALSAKTRIAENVQSNDEFNHTVSAANYETDATRVPKIGSGKLGRKIKQQLNRFDIKYGILPKWEQ